MEEGMPLAGLFPHGFQGDQSVQIRHRPRIETGRRSASFRGLLLATPSREQWPQHLTDRWCGNRRRSQRTTELRYRVEHPLELLGSPGKDRRAPIDVLERQGDPVTVV